MLDIYWKGIDYILEESSDILFLCHGPLYRFQNRGKVHTLSGRDTSTDFHPPDYTTDTGMCLFELLRSVL